MKYRIYIDEVGNSDLKSSAHEDHRFLSLTGVVFDLAYVKDVLSPQLEELKKEYFNSHPDEPIVFHRKELLHKKPPFSILQDPEVEKSFNEKLLYLLQTWDYEVISVLIDKLDHDRKYTTWKYDPYHYCQEILLERFKLFLELKNAQGDVMIESRGGKEDMRLKTSFRKLMDDGTNFLKAELLAERMTSKELKVKKKELNIAGLQIADLLAHPARRYFLKTVLKMDDGKVTFGDKVVEILEKDKFFRYKGVVYGYGAKKLP